MFAALQWKGLAYKKVSEFTQKKFYEIDSEDHIHNATNFLTYELAQ